MHFTLHPHLAYFYIFIWNVPLSTRPHTLDYLVNFLLSWQKINPTMFIINCQFEQNVKPSLFLPYPGCCLSLSYMNVIWMFLDCGQNEQFKDVTLGSLICILNYLLTFYKPYQLIKRKISILMYNKVIICSAFYKLLKN